MLVKKLLPIVFLLGCSKTLDSGDDEAILDTPDGEWNLDFQWPDSRVRMYGTPEFPFGQFGLNEQGKVVPDPETQREWVPFLPSTPPLPAYPFDFLPPPYPRGVPQLDAIALAQKNPQNYEMTFGDYEGSHNIPETTNPRSFLTGNFAVYVTVPDSLPGKHPQPPGMHKAYWLAAPPPINVLTAVSIAGKINTVGVPCNIIPPGSLENPFNDPNGVAFVDNPFKDCQDYANAGIDKIGPDWELSMLSKWQASESSHCLNGGGIDGLTQTSLRDRIENQVAWNDGLVFINWSEIEDWMLDIDSWAGEFGYENTTDEILQEMAEFLGEGEEVAGLTPPYFTNSGLCAFFAELSHVDGSVQTTSGCPEGHYASFFPFEIGALETGLLDSVEGYCALPFYVVDIVEDMEVPMPVLPPEFSNGVDTPNGTLMYTIDLNVVDADMLLSWYRNVSYERTEKGWKLLSKNPAGENVLGYFGLQTGDVLTGVNSDISLKRENEELARGVMISSLCGEDSECVSSHEETPTDLLLFSIIEDRLLAVKPVTLWVRRGDQMLPTYLRVRPLKTEGGVP